MRLLIGVVLVTVGQVGNLTAQAATGPVLTCDAISNARPGGGVAYKGILSNDDYRFTAPIPEGLTGWGAASGAPFHGFTIFLDSGRSGCINFVIGIRVEPPEDAPAQPRKLDRVANTKVGNRTATRTVKAGYVGATRFENLTVKVDLPRDGYRNEATITLVTPSKEKGQMTSVFEKFLSQIRFW